MFLSPDTLCLGYGLAAGAPRPQLLSGGAPSPSSRLRDGHTSQQSSAQPRVTLSQSFPMSRPPYVDSLFINPLIVPKLADPFISGLYLTEPCCDTGSSLGSFLSCWSFRAPLAPEVMMMAASSVPCVLTYLPVGTHTSLLRIPRLREALTCPGPESLQVGGPGFAPRPSGSILTFNHQTWLHPLPPLAFLEEKNSCEFKLQPRLQSVCSSTHV